MKSFGGWRRRRKESFKFSRLIMSSSAGSDWKDLSPDGNFRVWFVFKAADWRTKKIVFFLFSHFCSLNLVKRRRRKSTAHNTATFCHKTHIFFTPLKVLVRFWCRSFYNPAFDTKRHVCKTTTSNWFTKGGHSRLYVTPYLSPKYGFLLWQLPNQVNATLTANAVSI